MKNLSIILKVSALSIVCATVSVSAQIQQAWVGKYNNGVTTGNHQALKATLDNAGNIYVLGVSANANTNTGYVVVKYAPNGNQLWASRYDSTNFANASPTGFALDSSNNIIVTGSAATVKYDADGNQLWIAPYNAQAIAVDSGQNIYITGVAGNFTTIKLNPTGSNVWAQTWTYQGLPNSSQAIAVDSSSNVYVAGLETEVAVRNNYQIVGLLKYNSSGSQIWNDKFDQDIAFTLPNVARLVTDGLGSVYIEFNLAYGPGDTSGYQTSKINADGSIAWQAHDPTDNGQSLAYDMAIENSGNVVVTGGNAHLIYPNNRYGTYGIDTNGNYVWSDTYPTVVTGNSVATSIVVDQANSVYVTGFSPSLGTNGDSDIVTIRYDSNGNQVWLQRYDGPEHGNDAGNAISVDNSGNVYVAGYETETNGFTSMILIKYSPVSGQKQSNGNFILHAFGSPGESFDLQASTNLQTWQDLGSVIADTNGIVSFDDTNAPLFPNRFYYTVPQ